MPTTTQPPGRFNVRVYGIWINESQEIFVTEEQISGLGQVFKFPGGGLELGEGPLEGLRREWEEETGKPPQVVRHLYTTHFFQRSAFDANDQILSIYFGVVADGAHRPEKIDLEDDVVAFHWLPLTAELLETIRLPIDRYVVRRLLERPQQTQHWADWVRRAKDGW